MKKTFLLPLVCLFHLVSFAQPGKPALHIRRLVDSFYTYVSYGEYNGQNYPANAMYMVTDDGVVLFDTPWGEVYYQALLDSIQIRHGKKVVLCVSTHYHEDRTGGLTYYNGKGIETYTTRLTDSLCIVNKQNRATHHFTSDTTFTIGGHSFEAFYPGPGHTQDNIVLWFPTEKILYGGCFIKSASDKDLGNLNSANVKEWGNSIHRLQNHIGKPAYIIVGHNDFTNLNSLTHTLEMVQAYNAKVN
jgi:metallo-beta-lactamase class B